MYGGVGVAVSNGGDYSMLPLLKRITLRIGHDIIHPPCFRSESIPRHPIGRKIHISGTAPRDPIVFDQSLVREANRNSDNPSGLRHGVLRHSLGKVRCRTRKQASDVLT
jgi:hypothetical protein